MDALKSEVIVLFWSQFINDIHGDHIIQKSLFYT